ncbi:ATP-dependent DNA helicase [Caligus rogercresseyi]|uniref:ATP-dependent DNA helicase n=1 Tax=Caligus rogercresseyi TaxID=217165 RepID=A0A7T8JSY0_CALRO|nr:ATP-dependent DNA helicase [Caligus rogercresseyi]
MLLRNLHPPSLCNGTKLVVTKLLPNVIKAKVLTGSGKGEEVMIPRIPSFPPQVIWHSASRDFSFQCAFALPCQ